MDFAGTHAALLALWNVTCTEVGCRFPLQRQPLGASHAQPFGAPSHPKKGFENGAWGALAHIRHIGSGLRAQQVEVRNKPNWPQHPATRAMGPTHQSCNSQRAAGAEGEASRFHLQGGARGWRGIWKWVSKITSSLVRYSQRSYPAWCVCGVGVLDSDYPILEHHVAVSKNQGSLI